MGDVPQGNKCFLPGSLLQVEGKGPGARVAQAGKEVNGLTDQSR